MGVGGEMYRIVDVRTGRFVTSAKTIDRQNHSKMGSNSCPSLVLGSESEGDRPHRFNSKKSASLAILAEFSGIQDKLVIEEC